MIELGNLCFDFHGELPCHPAGLYIALRTGDMGHGTWVRFGGATWLGPLGERGVRNIWCSMRHHRMFISASKHGNIGT